LKILYVITGLGMGGAERQVIDIADRMVGAGHEVMIAYLTGPALVRPKSDHVAIIGFNMKKSIRGLVDAYCKLRNLIKSVKPDVVHSHMVHANILARLVRLSSVIPRLICTAHNTNEGGWLRMLAYRVTHRLADVTTNVSQQAVAVFEDKGAVPRGTMLAVTNGIDTERFKPSMTSRYSMRSQNGIDNSTKVVIAIGRLNEAKDYPNLLRAYAGVLKFHENTRLWIIGDGPLKSTLMQQASDLRISDNVTFFGIQQNVEDWLNAADVFVLSSAWEGFGLVVAEAMACEKVVVATDAGGVKEVLGEGGFLVPTRTSALLAEALLKALRLPPPKVLDLGLQARNRVVANYSIDGAVKRWLELYCTSV